MKLAPHLGLPREDGWAFPASWADKAWKGLPPQRDPGACTCPRLGRRSNPGTPLRCTSPGPLPDDSQRRGERPARGRVCRARKVIPRLEDLCVRPALRVPRAAFVSFSARGAVNSGGGLAPFPGGAVREGLRALGWAGRPGSPDEVEGWVQVVREPKGPIEAGVQPPSNKSANAHRSPDPRGARQSRSGRVFALVVLSDEGRRGVLPQETRSAARSESALYNERRPAQIASAGKRLRLGRPNARPTGGAAHGPTRRSDTLPWGG